MNRTNFTKFLSISLLVLLNFFFVSTTSAAALTTVSATLSRAKAAQTADHQYRFTSPSGVQSGDTITLTFPAGSFTMAASLTGVTIANGGGSDNAVTSASWSAPTLTITASASSIVTAAAVGTIKIPSAQITNPAVGTYVVSIAGTFGDTGTVAIPIITEDQVSMTASVDASMTFSLSGSSSAFGTLSTGSVATASPNITLTMGTNTNTGYTIYVRDQGNGTVGGLYNSSSNSNIASATALLSGGTEGYGVQASSAGATISAPYNVSGNNVGQLQRTGQQLASYNTYTASNHTITVTHLAAISTSTRPGAYADTITYVATGNY